jgi:hypothetical protein
MVNVGLPAAVRKMSRLERRAWNQNKMAIISARREEETVGN